MHESGRQSFFAWIGLVLIGGLAAGCGGTSSEIMKAQEEAVEAEYQEAIEDLSSMPPEMRERRMMRIERDFGKRPEVETPAQE